MLLHARILEIGQARARAVFLRFKNFLYRPNESHDFVSLCFVIQWVVSCSIDVSFSDFVQSCISWFTISDLLSCVNDYKSGL